MDCTILLFNRTIVAPSPPLCTYYNYHVVWGLMVVCMGAAVCLLNVANERPGGWQYVWLGFFFFGIELGLVALCVVAPFVPMRRVNVVYSCRDTPIAEQVLAIEEGVPVQPDQNPAPSAEMIFVGNPVVQKAF